MMVIIVLLFFFFQAEDGIRDIGVTGVQTCALPISELTVGAALTLGAIVAPPDAVSATAVGRRLGLPRQVMTLLGGESLLDRKRVGVGKECRSRWSPYH